MSEIISPRSPDPTISDLSPREDILPLSFEFSLRAYSRWLYPFINRYNYGSQTKYGDWRQISKAVLKRAMSNRNFREVEKLTERHLKDHLQELVTYYYTGSRRENILLLCLDLDAHDGQTDAPALAEYLAEKFLRNNCYIEPSTHGIGRHMYFLASFDRYTSTEALFTMTRELNGILEADRKRAGFKANLDPGTGGLPSDWKRDRMAHLIKLPRPRSKGDLERLLALTAMPLKELVMEARNTGGSVGTVGSEGVMPFQGSVVPCVSSNIIDCDDNSHSKENINENTSVSNPRKHPSALYTRDTLAEIRNRKPLYRALWTVRGLARAFGRMPTIAEALAVYEEFGIGTGACTARRIRRFENAIAYTARTFDPKKVKRAGFLREYPFLKRRIEQAMANTHVSLNYRRNVLTIDNLCVALYFAKYQLSRGDDKTNFGTLPIKGIVELSKRLEQDHGLKVIPNQKASACRRILCQLGLLELTDGHYQFWGVRRAKRYRLRENISKGPLITLSQTASNDARTNQD